MMKSRRISLALALGTVVVTASAHAGLLDDAPPPIPGGTPARVVYRMGPVHADPGYVDTVIRCHNNADVPVAMAVEIYGEDDAPVSLAVRDAVPPGEEAVFVTSRGVGGAAGVVMPGLSLLEHGKARVSAPTSHLSCVGEQIIRSAIDGPMQVAPLELVKKVASSDP